LPEIAAACGLFSAWIDSIFWMNQHPQQVLRPASAEDASLQKFGPAEPDKLSTAPLAKEYQTMKSKNPASPKKLLLVVEHSPHVGAVIKMINQIKWPAGSSIFLLAAVPEQLPLMETTFAARASVNEAVEIIRWRGWAATKLMADQISARLRARRLTIEKIEICAGQLAELTLAHARDIAPDMIVFGEQTLSRPEHFWEDPAVQELAQQASESLLVVRPSKQICPLNTILAVDDSPEAWQAIDFVQALSLPDWARITLLYLSGEQPTPPAGIDSSPAESFAAQAISYMHDCGVSVRWLHRGGSPSGNVLTVAQEQEADLIIWGTKYPSPPQLTTLPNITQDIVTQAPCSVLLVKHKLIKTKQAHPKEG
jgi:nucleotide-binding universal stress UspA family protein